MYQRRPTLLLVLVLLALCPTLGAAQDKLLTIDDIFDPGKKVDFNGTPASPRWLKDGTHFLQTNPANSGQPRIVQVDALTGAAVPFFDAARMQAALVAAGLGAEDARQLAGRGSYQLNPAQTGVLLNHNNDLYYYELGGAQAARLTNNQAAEVGETFSPDGRKVGFVRGNNLFVLDLATRQEQQLTRDGGPKLLNGRLDWVYQEELYGRGNFEAYWWSPDSTQLAFLQLDETPVPDFVVVDHLPLHQEVETTPYPKAGDPNPLVKLGIVSAGGGGAVRWVDTAKYQPADLLIVRVGWTPDGRHVVYQAQNREQTFLDLNYADPRTGQTTNVLHETTRAWVEAVDDNPRWLRDGSFLWLSDRSGFRHIYHYAPAGQLRHTVTQGRWDVRSIDAVDETRGLVYYTGMADSPIANNAYRVQLDGTGTTRLTSGPQQHRVDFNPPATYYVEYRSDINTPTQVRLYNAAGTQVRVIDENKVPALAQYKLGRPEFVQVETRDGFKLEAMLIKPPDFDPARKYPVLEITYSGPQAPQVRNAWLGQNYLWYQLLAQRGYLIWVCDNRSASNKGVESAWPVYGNFGELELRDLEDGLSWLKRQPFVDGTRIGLYGWSFGGFMTTYALTHSQSYKLGIAGGSVTSWRDYDSIYTERYMKTPQHNPEGYDRSAPQRAARNLHGQLLLIHGTLDDNVHLQNTLQFVYELQQAGKPFQLMLYPKSRHGVSAPLLLKHLRQTMTDFIINNL